MQRQPQPVPLDADSLYISTSPLVNSGFHWAFIHIDKEGKATRHHWVATNPNFVQGPEGYLESMLPQGPQDTSRAGALPVLAFFKVTDYRPMPVADFKASCVAVFPQSRPTAQANRQAGITCRTWVLGVLESILGSTRAGAIEGAVTRQSTTLNNTYTTDFLFSRRYETRVVALPVRIHS